MNPDALPLNEVFGPTWQGEGPHTGTFCWFVRLGLCNLHCSWCDTPYTWDSSRYDLTAENPERTVADILDMLDQLDAGHGAPVVVSGGEPLMHKGRPALQALLTDSRYEWHVETNGTLPPPPWWEVVHHTTVSPKVAQSDDPESKRIRLTSLRAWADYAHAGRAAFKFVVRTDGHMIEDLTDVLELTQNLDLCDAHVYVMPEGTTAEGIIRGMRTLAPALLETGWNLSTRLHTLLWDDKRGV